MKTAMQSFLLVVSCCWVLGSTAYAAPHITAQDIAGRSLHMRLDASGSWGIGSQMFVGGQVHALLHWSMWNSDKATGSLDFSLRLAYGYEPTFLAPWREPNDGRTLERFQGQVGIGHTFHMGRSRFFSLGFHVLLGWNHYHQFVPIDWPDVGVKGEGEVRFNHLVVSGEMTLAFRLHERVGLNIAVGAPFPTMTNYVITMVHVSAGLSIYLF